jgi:hypothetical protein
LILRVVEQVQFMIAVVRVLIKSCANLKEVSMFTRWSEVIYRISSGWISLVSLVIFLAFSAFVLPDQAAQAERYSAGAGTPDTSFFYTPADLYQMAEEYGFEGRQAYLQARWTFDLAFPLVYTFFLLAAMAWTYKRAYPPASSRRHFVMLPLVGALFDYLENSAVSFVMLRFPVKTPVVDLMAPVFTLLKWLFIGASFGLLIWGLLVLVNRWMIQVNIKR